MKVKRKMDFRLTKDEDDYPPFDVEGLWTETDDGINYRIDNIPIFANQATVADVVRALPESDTLVFSHLVENAGHSLIRVFVTKDQRGRIGEIREALRQLQCASEEFSTYPIIAVDVPPAVSIAPVREFLDALSTDKVIDYEEAIFRHD